MSIRCECTDNGYEHSAQACQKIAIYRVTRDGKRIAVCDDCILIESIDQNPKRIPEDKR